MAESSPTSRDIIKLAFPLLFGALANWTLYGVLCVQTYVYSYNFPSDKRMTNFLVYLVFALETTQTALSGADAHYWFIDGFGKLERLHSSHYSPIDMPILGAITALIVQMYFSYRIWTLTRNMWLFSVISITSVASATGSVWGGIASLVVGKYAVSNVALYIWSISSAVADILIATAMTLLLRRTRGTEGLFSRFVLVRVVRVTIETNILTASVAIASFVLYVAFPNEIYYTLTVAIMGKLYANTLLVSLNNRIYFRDQASGSSGDGDTSRLTATSQIQFAGAETRLRIPVEVFKLETTTSSGDLESGKDESASVKSDPSHAPGDAIHIKTGPSIARPPPAHGQKVTDI